VRAASRAATASGSPSARHRSEPEDPLRGDHPEQHQQKKERGEGVEERRERPKRGPAQERLRAVVLGAPRSVAEAHEEGVGPVQHVSEWRRERPCAPPQLR